MQKRKKNVGRKASLGRHHKENVGRKTFRDRHQKNNVKPYRGMTEYEIKSLTLAVIALILPYVERLIVHLVHLPIFTAAVNFISG
jgi:hypothetical protein